MSVAQSPAGRWVVRYRDTTGSHRSKTFTLKKDAERYERDRKVDRERGTDLPSLRTETLTDLVRVWWPSVERSVKPRSAERYAEIEA